MQAKWAVITGGSRTGIGRRLATELMLRNINVIATSLHLDDFEDVNPPSDANCDPGRL